MKPAASAAYSLLTAAAVRQRCQRLLAVGLDGKLQHFKVELDRLDATADLVIDCTRRTYPHFDVPLHSRWRHFTVDVPIGGLRPGRHRLAVRASGPDARSSTRRYTVRKCASVSPTFTG